MTTPTDLRLTWDAASGVADLEVSLGDLTTDDGLRQAVLLSLFLDRYSEEAVEGERRGWWADEFGPAGDLVGSRLWTLRRAKPTAQTLEQVKTYAREALVWLVEDGVAAEVSTSATYGTLGGSRSITLTVALTRPISGTAEFRFDGAWLAEGSR
jgi:phage gp46-like protein